MYACFLSAFISGGFSLMLERDEGVLMEVTSDYCEVLALIWSATRRDEVAAVATSELSSRHL